MTETYAELKKKLLALETPPWLKGLTNIPGGSIGGEGAYAPEPGEYATWQAEILRLEAEITALQQINRP